MTKLRSEQLSRALAGTLAPIYLVSGDEPLLVQESCDAIRNAAREQGFLERERHHVDSSFDWGLLHASANSLSLFANKKIIELRIPNAKPGTDGSRALTEYASAPAGDTLLLVVTGKLDGSAQKTKWYKALEQAGVHTAIWPVEAAKLPSWINARLQSAGLTADSGAIDLLAARIEGNLLAAVQEIEKLKLLTDDGVISSQLMASVVADSARYDMFTLADKALAGDTRNAVKCLQGLKSEGTQIPPLLWTLTRDIRQLLQCAQLIQQGRSTSAAMQQAGVWGKRQARMGSALNRLKAPQLQLLLRQANGVDRATKGMRNADPWDELLDLVLNLSGVTSLKPSNTRLGLKL